MILNHTLCCVRQMIKEKKLERRRRRKKEAEEWQDRLTSAQERQEEEPRPPPESAHAQELENRAEGETSKNAKDETDVGSTKRRRRRRRRAEENARTDDDTEEELHEVKGDPVRAEPSIVEKRRSPSPQSPLTLTPHPMVVPHTIIVRPSSRNPLGVRTTPLPPDSQVREPRNGSAEQRGSYRCESICSYRFLGNLSLLLCMPLILQFFNLLWSGKGNHGPI